MHKSRREEGTRRAKELSAAYEKSNYREKCVIDDALRMHEERSAKAVWVNGGQRAS